MAKKNNDPFKFEIEEVVGILKENDKHDWCTAVTKMSWNDAPAKMDIRNVNLPQNRIGKGISLSDEEVDAAVDIFLDRGYGSVESLRSALEQRVARFTVSGKKPVKGAIYNASITAYLPEDDLPPWDI